MEGKEFWTRPKVEQLCELWKTKASLYNPDHEYPDRWQKRRDSEEIAQHLGTTVRELLKKMKNLRTQYGRERRKTCFSLADNCDVSSSKWYLLSMLRFLDQSDASASSVEAVQAKTPQWEEQVAVTALHNQEQQSGATFSGTTDCTFHEIIVEVMDDVPDPPRSGQTVAVARKRMRPANEDVSDVGSGKERDALDIFGKFVASELRLMENVQMQRQARLRIQKVLLDVQLGSAVPTPLHHEYSLINTPSSN
ncbi:uncharacterized protein LOC133141800 isoform X1 [Conger conger]|uniref:uncharacterized protein LOC133141800 isoform X1 n=1 Tax=Conger conger TaxID=82655 RepID=UPI002A5AA3D4|nr:uncharacterized protein LOC133141800 isoform X1 [Conger conger]